MGQNIQEVKGLIQPGVNLFERGSLLRVLHTFSCDRWDLEERKVSVKREGKKKS